MKAGVFMMPSHPPERSFYDGHYWDFQHLELCDKLGFHEAWIGEHFTAPWEPNPAPDLLIAQAILRTKAHQILVGPETVQRLGDGYRVESLGRQHLKNFADATDLYCVLGSANT